MLGLLHFQGEAKQLKIRLSLTFSKLPQQNCFEMIKKLICVKNVPWNLLGQVGQSIGIFEFLRLDTGRCELSLDEAEPDSWFHLIIGTQLDLSRCCYRDGLTNLYRHIG
jgi:hypothetical protein